MKNLALLPLLLGLIAGAFLGVQASAAQSLNYVFEYYQPPTGSPPPTRSPTRSSNAGHFVPMQSLGGAAANEFANYSETYNNPSVPQTVSISAQTSYTDTNTTNVYALGYINLSGGKGGAVTIYPDANGNLPTNNVPVTFASGTNITALYVYFLVGGNGVGHCTPPCPTGAAIDEFDEMSGQLANDPFVNVYTPPTASTPNAGLTMIGNDNGVVDTTSQSVSIQAYQNTATLSGVLDKWVAAPPSSRWSISGSHLTVNNQTNVYALANYRSCPTGYVWNMSGSISRCVLAPPPVCKGGEVLNSSNQCACPAGLILSGGVCVIPPKCPAKCKFGCYLPFVLPNGQLQINCKPPPGNQ